MIQRVVFGSGFSFRRRWYNRWKVFQVIFIFYTLHMQIKKFKPVDHFVRATVYGGSWVWKTVFWWTAPKPVFASAENGLLSIVSTLWYSPDFVEVKTIDDLQELYKFLKEKPHDYQTLVIDSMTEINEKIKEAIEKKLWKRMQIQDRGDLSAKIKWIIRWIQDLQMNVILICQEKLNTDDDGHVINVKPSLNWKNADEIAYLMDIVAYMYIDAQGNRMITTKPNPKIVSKDRTWLLQTDVSLNFSDRVVAMQNMNAGESEVVHDVSKQEASKKEKPQKPVEGKKITPGDKMIAMTAFSAYCDASKPEIDKKIYFAKFVDERFFKKIDELTEHEWKQLVEIVKARIASQERKQEDVKEESTTTLEAESAVAPIVEAPTERSVEEIVAPIEVAEAAAEIKANDAVYISDQWWVEKTEPVQPEAPKDRTKEIVDDLPF